MIKDIMDKNDNVVANTREIDKLKSILPNYFDKDGNFDINKLQDMLAKNEVDLTKESYELKFLGKNYAKYLSGLETETVITPDVEHNYLDENKDSENVYICGDNIDALSHLLHSYTEKVKMIYIDPPYNTGSDGFVYNDKFEFTPESLVKTMGIDIDEAEKIVNLNGRSTHSAWLTFMYPRLVMARELLKDDGVIFISIDDNEQSNLRLLCDDVFGEENFEGHIHWRRRNNQPNDKNKLIGLVAEHILVYAKNKSYLKSVGVGKLPITGNFSNPDNDPKGDWASKPWKTGSDQSGSRYEIKTPTNKVYNEEWMGEESTFKKLLEDNRIVFTNNGDGLPRKKYYKSEREEEGQCATNWWTCELFGYNQEANNTVTELLGEKNIFSNPKSTLLLSQIITLGNIKNDDIILDFFSGSATTAHSVMKLNAEDGGKRKYIMVQLPEAITEKDNKVAYGAGYKTICEIGIERIKRAAKQIKTNDHKPFDSGFKIYNLNNVTADTYDKLEKFEPDNHVMFADNVIEEYAFGNATGLDTILTTYLIRDGYVLGTSYKTILAKGYECFYCEDRLYLINAELSNDSIDEIIRLLESEELKINHIIMFGHSFTYAKAMSFRTNIKQLKNVSVPSVEVRY